MRFPVLNNFSHEFLIAPSILQAITRSLSFQSVNHSQFPEEPSPACYDDLINTAGRDGDFGTVCYLLNKRSEDGCFNTNNTFKFISVNISALGSLLQALACVDGWFPRKHAHDSLIARLSKSHLTEEALRVADAMLHGRYGATASTFHPILCELTKRKKMDEAWGVMDLMRKHEIPPDLTAYNYVLTAYCFAGDLKPAAEVLERIVSAGMEADTRTYDALVLGACRTGKVEGALVLLRRMVEIGVPALYSTHAHVIGAMLKMGHYTQAVEFVMSYAGRDMALDSENFGLLASRFIKLRKLDEAKLILKEMKERGIAMGNKLKLFYDSYPTN